MFDCLMPLKFFMRLAPIILFSIWLSRSIVSNRQLSLYLKIWQNSKPALTLLCDTAFLYCLMADSPNCSSGCRLNDIFIYGLCSWHWCFWSFYFFARCSIRRASPTMSNLDRLLVVKTVVQNSVIFVVLSLFFLQIHIILLETQFYFQFRHLFIYFFFHFINIIKPILNNDDN